MKITYKGDYALKAIFQLALRHDDESDGVMSISEIARHGDMPTKFLEQILLALRKGGFVKSKRGINGGFSLAKAAKDITVGEIVRFIEGPIEPISCVKEDKYKGCKDTASCIFRGVWQEVAEATSKVVDNLTLADLIIRYKDKRHSSRSDYEYAI
ncbi:MAG: Rrf2 family transcriptional regulator [Candidatus Omnitrophota bacterium]|nr:Rrf2 family transcriptional regulator [Candidatus Omnitrophota bacterium]